jgi:hypothetical protein
MFCPKCGSAYQSDELKFCKSCGANLEIVRMAMDKGKAPDKFDWNKTWLAEIMLSGEESVRRAKEIERLQGITPEVKRRNEIKAGVITASVGFGLMILLYFLMGGIIASGRVSDAAAAILSRVWVAGVIPLFVGAALIFNGAFISRPSRVIGSSRSEGNREFGTAPDAEYLPPAETKRIDAGIPFSVTDETTRHLEEAAIPRVRAASSEDQ